MAAVTGRPRVGTGPDDFGSARPLGLPAHGTSPHPGEVWTVNTLIAAPTTGHVLEDSALPVEMFVLGQFGDVVRVAPISFDVDMAGPGDIVLKPGVYGLPSVVECWLPLLVTRQALGRRVSEPDLVSLQQAKEAIAQALSGQVQDLDQLDPRVAFRQSERLRVFFATAGSGESFTDAAIPEGTEEALAKKERFRAYRLEPATTSSETGTTVVA